MSPLRSAVVPYAAGFVLGFVFVSTAALSAVLTQRLGLTSAEYGILYSPQTVCAGLGALAGGFLARRFGLRRLLVAGMLAAGLSQGSFWCSAMGAGLGLPAGVAYVAALAGAALTGAAGGLTAAPLNAWPQMLFPKHAEASVVMMHTVMGAGLAGGPLLVAAAHRAGRVEAALVLGFLVTLALAIVGARAALPAAGATGGSAAGLAVEPADHPRHAPAFWLFVAAGVLYGVTEAAFSNWVVLYLEGERRLDPTTASLALSAFWAALTVGRVTTTAVLVRPGAAKAVWIALPAIMVMAFVALPFVRTRPLALGAFALAGLGCSAHYPLTVGLASKRFPAHVAWIAAMLYAALVAGIGGGSFVLGALHERFALAALYPALSVVAVTLLLVQLALERGARGRPL